MPHLTPHRTPISTRGHRVSRGTAILCLAVIAMMASASAAWGHAAVRPGTAETGVPVTFEVLIPHGCTEGEPPPPPGTEVQPTRLVAVEIPDGMEVTGVQPADGFTESLTDTEIVWEGGSLANEDPGFFTFEAILTGDEGTRTPVNIYQECTDELSYRWAGDGGASPAPVLTLGARSADAPAGGPPPTETPTTEPTAPEAPATDQPASEVPATDPPATDEPTGTPTTEAPTTEAPTPQPEASATPTATADDADVVEVTDGGGVGAVPVIVGALALVAVVGALVVGRSRQRDLLDDEDELR